MRGTSGFASQPPKAKATKKQQLPCQNIKAWTREGLQKLLQQQKLATAPSACANCGISDESKGANLSSCSRHKAVRYCGKACQLKRWKEVGNRVQCSAFKPK